MVIAITAKGFTMHKFMRTAARLTMGVAMLAGVGYAGAGPAAAATGNCGSYAYGSDVVCYMAWLGTPGYSEYVINHVYVSKADGHDYARGMAAADYGSQVYNDISRDGGKTWVGRQYVATSNSPGTTLISTTASVYDGPGYWVRSCIFSASQGSVICTQWY
jgi:hypothetical protein